MGPSPGCASYNSCYRHIPRASAVGDIGSESEIPGSTLSHHLDKLKNEDLVRVRRESTFLVQRQYAALQELLGFLFDECCTRNQAVKPEKIINISK